MVEASRVNPMAAMSRAIRLTIEPYGPTLRHIPDKDLAEFATIVAAFAADLNDERNRRAALVGRDA